MWHSRHVPLIHPLKISRQRGTISRPKLNTHVTQEARGIREINEKEPAVFTVMQVMSTMLVLLTQPGHYTCMVSFSDNDI